MAFWNDPSSLLPKQSHRWVIFLGNSSTLTDKVNIPHYFAKSVDRPTYKIDSVQVKYLYSHTFNFPKRLVWNPIKIQFNDVVILDGNPKDGFIDNFIVQPKISSDGKSVESNKKNVDILEERKPETSFLSRIDSPRSIETSAEQVQIDGGIASIIRGSNASQVTVRGEEASRSQFETKIKYDISYQKSTQLFFYDFLHKCGYFDPNELDTEDKLLRFRSYHFKKNMVDSITNKSVNLLNNNDSKYSDSYISLVEINELGEWQEEWKIYNPLISSISSDKLDYSADNILNITVDLVYDWAELVPHIGKKSLDELNKAKLDAYLAAK